MLSNNLYKVCFQWYDTLTPCSLALTNAFFLQNGMTPLHLAVWHSLRAEEFLTVKTLLEHNADCSAKDNV
jgi:hypothetical protein